MDVSILIVNYNTPRITRDCVASVISHTSGLSYEIIVVDNSMTEDCSNALSEFPDVSCIRSNSNVGFGRANNLAAAKAKGKYLFLLNSDTVLLNNAVKYFYDYFENAAENSVGVLGSILLNADMSPGHSFGKIPTISSLTKEMFCLPFLRLFNKKIESDVTDDDKSKDSFMVERVIGADMFLRSDLYRSMGGFDEDFFLYYEDTELQYRILKQGYSNFIIKGPEIIHLDGASKGKQSRKYSAIDISSKMLFYKKRYGMVPYLFSRLLFGLKILPVSLSGLSFKEKTQLYKILLGRLS